jgi:hypothetical protein
MDAAIMMRIVIAEWERLEPPIWALSVLGDEAAGTWLVSVTESTEAGWPLETVSGLFPCVGDVGVLDVEWVEEVEGVREVVVGVGAAELVELTELWLNVDETDEIAGLDTDEAADELGWGEREADEGCDVSEGAERAVLEGVEEERPSVEGLGAAPTAPEAWGGCWRGTGGNAARILIMRLRLRWSRRCGESGMMAFAEDGRARAKRMAREKRRVMARLRLGRMDMARRV